MASHSRKDLSTCSLARPITMKVKDVRSDSKVDVLELTVKEKGEVRNVNTRMGASRVCDAKCEDDEGGSITLSLWNDEIDKVSVDDKIKITNGWARQFRGNLQVSAGRFGKLEVLGQQPA